MVVGRDDGSLEVYRLEDSYAAPDAPSARAAVDECITGLDVGALRDPGVQEIVLTTFSGKVLSFWDSRRLDLNDPKIKQAQSNKAKALKGEVKKLKEKLAQTKIVKASETESSVPLTDNVQPANVRMKLLSSDAAYLITIESQAQIDFVALQSNIHADLLDLQANKAIVSVTEGDKTSPLLATLRPEDPSRRLDVKLRTTEGQAGEIECLVFQKLSSVCQSFHLSVKPLSLHERVPGPGGKAPAMSSMRVRGNFTENDMNTWLSLCVMDTPQHVEEEGNVVWYKSLFTGSWLVCEYGKKDAVIKSDSITSLTIVKDSIMKSASLRKTAIDVSFDMRDECTFSLLQLLHPKIQELYELKQKADLVETVKELKLQQEQEALGGEKTFELPEEYEAIAANAETIVREQKGQPKKLEYIYGIIVDLFMDRAKALGVQNAETKIPALEHCLQNYDYQQLTNFFKSFK